MALTKKKNSVTNTVLLILVLVVLLAIAGLLIYRDYYLKSQPVEIRYLDSTTENLESVTEKQLNRQRNYIAVEFQPEVTPKRIEEILTAEGFENKNSEELVYNLAFPGVEGFDNWYKIKIPSLKNPQELIEAFQAYEEVNFVEAVFE